MTERHVKVKSTLRVVDARSIEERTGVTSGQTLRPLVGNERIPADRTRVALATYEPGTVEPLHWHQVEAFYFVVSGRAIVRDIEGRETTVSSGTFVYAPAGISGAHEWEAVDRLELLSVRSVVESSRKLQFTVDRETMRSYIDLEELARRQAIDFPSHY
jgi:mannose-6-phosphate isomerase-like protein (cupin superfamily)